LTETHTKALSPNTPVALGLVATLLLLSFNIGDRWAAQKEQERRTEVLEAEVKLLRHAINSHELQTATNTQQMGHLVEAVNKLEATIKEPPRRQR
jgi:LytS/YehU family sensor histidine kinase